MDFEKTFERKFAELTFFHPLINAAGTCKMYDGDKLSAKEIARSASSAVLIGSITREERPGNSGNVLWYDDLYTLNSLGLPNPGKAYYEKHLPHILRLTREYGKWLFVSVAGFNVEEYVVLTEMAFQKGVDVVELNFGCPNIVEHAVQKPVICFDEELVEEILSAVQTNIGKEMRIVVKISPFSDFYRLKRIANIIAKFEVVKGISAINTFPNAFIGEEQGRPVITPNSGLAGLSGPAIKPVALGHLVQLRNVLPERIQLIGAGGISWGKDIVEFEQQGAVLVQTASSLIKEGPNVFSRLITEYIDQKEEKMEGLE